MRCVWLVCPTRWLAEDRLWGHPVSHMRMRFVRQHRHTRARKPIARVNVHCTHVCLVTTCTQYQNACARICIAKTQIQRTPESLDIPRERMRAFVLFTEHTHAHTTCTNTRTHRTHRWRLDARALVMRFHFTHQIWYHLIARLCERERTRTRLFREFAVAVAAVAVASAVVAIESILTLCIRSGHSSSVQHALSLGRDRPQRDHQIEINLQLAKSRNASGTLCDVWRGMAWRVDLCGGCLVVALLRTMRNCDNWQSKHKRNRNETARTASAHKTAAFRFASSDTLGAQTRSLSLCLSLRLPDVNRVW